MVMRCLHYDYDEYFERCMECSAPGWRIHADQCPGRLRPDEEDDGWFTCDDCNVLLSDDGSQVAA